MNLKKQRKQLKRRAGMAAIGSLFAMPVAHAFVIDTGESDVKMLWDNTVKYSNAFRLKSADPALIGDINADDGDRNFGKGIISNRVDLLSEFDVSYHGFGARVSGAAWYDTVYNRSNDNNSPTTANAVSVPNNAFTEGTRDLHGRKAEILDAFIHGKADIGDMKGTFRLGKHTLLWGESLFLGANAIAGGQAAIDVVKALSVPGSQFKEIGRPSNQISAELQVNPKLSFGAYYKLSWEALRLPGAGSYFSSTDFLGGGNERLLIDPSVPLGFYHGNDITAKSSGQGGVQARFRVGDVDYGLYAIRFHDMGPQLYLRPGGAPSPAAGGLSLGQYEWVYHEGITAYGASATATVGAVNYAIEVSTRRNTDFNSVAGVDLTGTANNSNNPLYAIGNSAHINLSALASFGPSFIAKEASLVAEIAWNRRLSVTQNEKALETTTNAGTSGVTRDATLMRFKYEPAYRQVLDGVDLSVPFGVGYYISGNSSLGGFQRQGVGDVSIGLNGSYLDVWRFGLNLTHYFGPVGTTKYDQTLQDRDFMSFQVQRAF